VNSVKSPSLDRRFRHPGQVSDQINVTRWRRYGKDRLYVTAVGDERLGWHDLISGAVHIDRPEQAETLMAAINGWLGEAGRPPLPLGEPEPPGAEEPPALVAVVETEPVAEPVPDDDVDLAHQRAGAAVRARAVELQEAAPVMTMLARLLGVHTEERQWRLGAKGEEKVAAQLEKLATKDPRWRYINAIPIGERGSDIDHLIVGPGGVFTLNAKHHPGAKIRVYAHAFYVNGQLHPYIRNSVFEARRASRHLTAACGRPVGVLGVIVPVNADDIVVKTPPDGCAVINRMRLVGWLRKLPAALTDSAVEEIYRAACRLETWRATDPVRRSSSPAG
jgi:hypothetical protein